MFAREAFPEWYAAESLPPGFDEQRVSADDNLGTPVIFSRYDAGPGAYGSAFQQAPREVSLQPPRCTLHQLAD